MRQLLKLGALLAAGLSVQGATLERLSLEDMARKSTAIVRARAAGSYAALHGNVIYTHYRIEVLDRWKGGVTEREVVVPGGAVRGLRQTFPGSPKLTEGGEYVLFLWNGPSGLTHMIGLSQGVFGLSKDGAGQLTAYRAAIAAEMVDRSGRPVRDSGMSLRLSEMRQRVNSAMGQKEATR